MPLRLQLALFAVLGAAAGTSANAQLTPMAAQETPIVISRRLPPSADLLMRVVYIADLDLKSTSGQQELKKRVEKAVEDMCAIPGPLPSYKGPMEKPCRDEAWASALPQMSYAVERVQGSQ